MNTLLIVILACSVLAAIIVLAFMIDYKNLNSKSNRGPLLLLLVSIVNIIAVALALKKSDNK
ncbi:MAG TPA: hypothetical protein VHO68_00700 [Bacteroidales bacterium]|nr:hypothetical protein [Bacteroidales bacterium]